MLSVLTRGSRDSHLLVTGIRAVRRSPEHSRWSSPGSEDDSDICVNPAHHSQIYCLKSDRHDIRAVPDVHRKSTRAIGRSWGVATLLSISLYFKIAFAPEGHAMKPLQSPPSISATLMNGTTRFYAADFFLFVAMAKVAAMPARRRRTRLPGPPRQPNASCRSIPRTLFARNVRTPSFPGSTAHLRDWPGNEPVRWNGPGACRSGRRLALPAGKVGITTTSTCRGLQQPDPAMPWAKEVVKKFGEISACRLHVFPTPPRPVSSPLRCRSSTSCIDGI